MNAGTRTMFAGYLLGLAGIMFWVPANGSREAALTGWLLCAVIEVALARRRFRVLQPDQPAVSFAVVLAGGFLVKLVALAGIGLLAHFMDLFPPKPFLLAFLAALVWGETLSLSLLNHHLAQRDAGRRSEDT